MGAERRILRGVGGCRILQNRGGLQNATNLSNSASMKWPISEPGYGGVHSGLRVDSFWGRKCSSFLRFSTDSACGGPELTVSGVVNARLF